MLHVCSLKNVHATHKMLICIRIRHFHVFCILLLGMLGVRGSVAAGGTSVRKLSVERMLIMMMMMNRKNAAPCTLLHTAAVVAVCCCCTLTLLTYSFLRVLFEQRNWKRSNSNNVYGNRCVTLLYITRALRLNIYTRIFSIKSSACTLADGMICITKHT